MVLPGSKVVTVPSVDVVVVVVLDSVVTGFCAVVDSVVVVLVCAKAKGAIAAQARMSMLFFMVFPSQCYCSDMVWNPLQTVNRAAFDEAAPVKVRQRSRRRYSTNFLSRRCAEKLSRVERFATFANVRDTWLLRPIPSSLPSW